MARRKVSPAAPAGAKGKRRAELAAVADAFKDFRPAREVMTLVRAVPTRFVQYDHASGVGGWPIERWTLIHGPSNEGKTAACLGLIDSFIDAGHYAFLADAERSTPADWVQKMLRGNYNSDRFFYERPDSYEEAREQVRKFCYAVLKVREATGKDICGLIVLDSLKALTPEGFFDKVTKGDEKAGMDGAGNRGGQILAKYNSAWMRELVILLDKTKCGMVAIAREMEDPNADKWARESGNDYKLAGGKDVYFDASLAVRVERDSWIQHGEGKDRKVYGERHKMTIRKTKIAGKEGKTSVARFHTSNGVLIPAGFDRVRDVLELAKTFGVVQQSGAWLSFEGERIANGLDNAVVMLTDNDDWLARIEKATRAAFAAHPAAEVADGPKVEFATAGATEPTQTPPRGPRKPV